MIKIAKQVLQESKWLLLAALTVSSSTAIIATPAQVTALASTALCSVIIWKGHVIYDKHLASINQQLEVKKRQATEISKKTVECINQLKQLHDREVTELQTRVKELSENAADAERTLGEAAAALEAQKERVSSLQAQTQGLRNKVAVIDLTCPYCNNSQPVDYSPVAGESECAVCHNLFAIHTNIFTARLTSPFGKE